MKQATFLRSVVVALVLSVSAAASFVLLSSMFPVSWVIRLIISSVSLVYIVYLMSMSEQRIGRVILVSFFAVGSLLMAYLQSTIGLYVVVHVGMIWLVRSLYFHNRLFVSMADLGLCALSFAVIIWANEQSSSVFLSFWSFFLVQAAILPILNCVFYQNKNNQQSVVGGFEDQSFQNAYRSAELAVRRVSSHR